MSEFDWLTIWRQMNVFLGIIALVMLLWRLYRRVDSGAILYFSLSMTIYTIAAIVVTSEAMRNEFPFGGRVPLITLAHTWAIYAVMHTRQSKK